MSETHATGNQAQPWNFSNLAKDKRYFGRHEEREIDDLEHPPICGNICVILGSPQAD